MKGFQANLREQLGESVEAVYMKNSMIHQHVVRTMHVYKVLARQGGSSFGVGYSRPEEGMELWIIQELCGLGDLSAFSKVSGRYLFLNVSETQNVNAAMLTNLDYLMSSGIIAEPTRRPLLPDCARNSVGSNVGAQLPSPERRCPRGPKARQHPAAAGQQQRKGFCVQGMFCMCSSLVAS
jgi:hypothetical protein